MCADNRNLETVLRGAALVPDSDFAEALKKRLVAVAKRSKKTPGKVNPFDVFRTVPGGVLVPKFAYFKLSSTLRPAFKIAEPPIDDKFATRFEGQLQPQQMPGVRTALNYLRKVRGVFVKGECGSGKTVVGTFLMHKLPGEHAAVMVDQTAIADQWTKEIRAHLPDATISFIMPLDSQKKICEKHGLSMEGRTHIDTKGRIIIAMAETLMSNSPANPINVVLLIVDEAHKFCAKRFSHTVFDFNFGYSVALTATDERDDKLDWIFRGFLGPYTAILKGKRMKASAVTLAVRTAVDIAEKDHRLYYCTRDRRSISRYGCSLTCTPFEGCMYRKGRGDKIDYTSLWTRLSLDPGWNKVMVRLTKYMYDTGRQAVIFSKFKDHLRYLQQQTIAAGVPQEKTSLFFGGMDKDESTGPQLTFATYGVYKHAIDTPQKDAVLFALPVKHIEQACGRIERFMDGKPMPIIIDPSTPTVPPLDGLRYAHSAFYKKESYGVWHVRSPEDARAWLVPRVPACQG